MKKMSFLLFLFLVTGAASAQIGAQSGATRLVDVHFASAWPYLTFDGKLVSDGTHSYLSTSGGLYRLPAKIEQGSRAELIAFAGTSVRNIYLHEGALYVLKANRARFDEPPSEHTILRSYDGGLTFQPLDENLKECLGGYCAYLEASEALFRDGTLIVNAGGNVLATRDDGATWSALVGQIAQQACYDPSLEVVGDRLIIGGECPLDEAYLRAGILRPDGLRWIREPESVRTPFLENRNIQFVRRLRDGKTVIVGIEGAILRSTDGGASFDFVFRQPIGSSTYVYFTTLLESQGNRLIIAGFDKGELGPALWQSDDGGATWRDRSSMLRFADHLFDAVVFLHEDAEGRLLAGLLNWDAQFIRIVELNLGERRRAVR